MSDPLLQCREISVRYDGVTALGDVDFELMPGEVHGLVGCNGAGKSTLMKVLAGNVPHYTGQIFWKGQPVRIDSPRTAIQQGIAMVYQELSGICSLSVAENLFLGRQPITRTGRIDWSRMKRDARQALSELDVHVDVKRPLKDFPLVVQQSVEIARGLHSGAQVLILDEPTSALSQPEIRRLFDLIRHLAQCGVTIVFISHFLEDVLAICDRVSIIRDGRRISTNSAGELSRPRIIAEMVGRGAEAQDQTRLEATLPAESNQPVRLRIDRLTAVPWFQDVSLRIRQGECVGLYGFAGAGHQDLLHVLFGARPRDDGEIRIDNKLRTIQKVSDAVRAGMVLVAADRSQTLVRQASLSRNITLAHMTTSVGRWLTRRKERKIVQPLLERVGCRPANPELRAGYLSGGNQQKVVLAKWLLGNVHVLLLEEPTRGMDVKAKDEVMNLIAELKQQGTAILLASTEPEMLLAHADRILTFHRGRITQQFSGTRITKSDLMHAAESVSES